LVIAGRLVLLDALKQIVEVASGEPPVVGPGDRVVAGFERADAVADLFGAGEVVRRHHLALDDGEVDLTLIESRGVDR
jgi:hypothetical protein